ncbi:MAG: WXG100 family type VII secretion target [Actinomycetota bacterium]|nr:WXG100 family type VII secretion target [Actinomycetota bacterium]
MPAEGHMLVTFGAVENAAADTDTVATHIDRQLGDLKAYLGPLAGSWTGQASGDYQALQARWDNSAADLNQVLRHIAGALRTAHGNYAQAENANATIWA